MEAYRSATLVVAIGRLPLRCPIASAMTDDGELGIVYGYGRYGRYRFDGMEAHRDGTRAGKFRSEERSGLRLLE